MLFMSNKGHVQTNFDVAFTCDDNVTIKTIF